MKEKKILIILGMHRSGTSLVTSWLQECGLNIGDNLLGEGIGNPKGHFEDMDFLNLHEGILKKNNFNYISAIPEKIKLDSTDFALANTLLEIKTKENEIVAWKDPRTCIFINNLWLKTKYEKKVIFIYRPYEQIIRSLYHRHIDSLYPDSGRYLLSNNLIKSLKRKWFIYKYKKEILDNYCKMYINYMQEILKAYNNIKNEDEILFININEIKQQQEKIIDLIISKWNFNIVKRKIDNVFSEGMLKNNKIDFSNINSDILQKCQSIDKKLISITNIDK